MAAVTCKYHTQTPARWHCESCQINFCLDCIKAPADHAPECPVCKQELTSLGVANLIKPFWTRLREFFLYPLYPAPLTVMLVLSLIAFMILHVPGWDIDIKTYVYKPVARNLIFAIPFLFVFLKYAHSVLEDTARGHMKPRPLALEQLTHNGLIVFKFFVLLVIYFWLLFAVHSLLGQAVTQITRLILLFTAPAVIMVLVLEKKLHKALDPEAVATIIMRIGAPYILLMVLIYPLVLARNTLIEILGGLVNPSLGITIFVFIFMYFFLIVVNMIGYLLYQYHEKLEFNVDVEVENIPDNKSKTPEQEINPEMRAVEILMHEGKADDAARQLEALIKSAPGNIEARERLLKLLRLIGDLPRHLEQGQGYIAFLMDENKTSQAARIFQECYEYDNQFKPQKPKERIELGKYLSHNNYPKLAMSLLNNLHKDFPSYENIPEAYLFVAQILCEQFNEDDKARQILQFILENYPEHSMRSEVEDYLRVVDNVSNH